MGYDPSWEARSTETLEEPLISNSISKTSFSVIVSYLAISLYLELYKFTEEKAMHLNDTFRPRLHKNPRRTNLWSDYLRNELRDCRKTHN